MSEMSTFLSSNRYAERVRVMESLERRMKLWTFHPSNFRLDDPTPSIIHELGKYWGSQTTPRYAAVLQRLHQLLGNDQILWCYTLKDNHWHFDGVDEIEWELNVPFSQIEALYDVQLWENILYGRNEDWDNLILDRLTAESAANECVGALVKWPLPPEYVQCLGAPRPRYPPSTQR